MLAAVQLQRQRSPRLPPAQRRVLTKRVTMLPAQTARLSSEAAKASDAIDAFLKEQDGSSPQASVQPTGAETSAAASGAASADASADASVDASVVADDLLKDAAAGTQEMPVL